MLPVRVSKYHSIILYPCSFFLRLVTLSLSQGLQNWEQLALTKAVISSVSAGAAVSLVVAKDLINFI